MVARFDALVIGTGQSSVPFFGACILVDLFKTNISIPLVFDPSNRATIGLPIPNISALKGVSLNVQSVHIEGLPAQLLAASDGTKLTIF